MTSRATPYATIPVQKQVPPYYPLSPILTATQPQPLPQPPVVITTTNPAPQQYPTPLEVNTVNTATIIFIIIAIAISAAALAMGVIAYLRYTDFYQQRQTIINNIRVAAFGDTVAVQTVSGSPDLLQLLVDLGTAINSQNLLINVSLRSQAGNTTISDYPYTVQNNTLQLTIPRTLALNSNIVYENIIRNSQSVYSFNSSQWQLVVAYRIANVLNTIV